jgi:uncharacterized protein YndB with AHSA1/START domain
MFTVTTDDGFVVVISGHLRCRAEAAFAAFVEPELLARWWQATAVTDPRPGGSYHMTWDGPGWHLRGEYTEVSPARRLAFTWSWDHEDVETDVTIDFHPIDGGTRVDVTHRYSTDEERDGYVEGWLHFLPRIADTV